MARTWAIRTRDMVVECHNSSSMMVNNLRWLEEWLARRISEVDQQTNFKTVLKTIGIK